MKLYFVRHGQTEANARQVYDGQRVNSPLTELGKQQARDAAEAIRPLTIGRIISSPLLRAQQTAEIIAEVLGGGLVINYDERLMERDNGTISGTPYRTLSFEELQAAEGSETADVFRQRVKDALVDAGSGSANTLVVSHGGVFTQYLSVHDGLPAEHYWHLTDPQNGQVEEIDINWQ